MKLKSILIVIILFSITQSRAQDTLEITFAKTTSVVFQYGIVNVDRGSGDVIAQKVKVVDNTLQIKAARRAFPETNLTVITADGKLHHFDVIYADAPKSQIYFIDSTATEVSFSKGLNVKAYLDKSTRIIKASKKHRVEKDAKFKIVLALNGIYIEGNQVFYDVSISNRSAIDYDIRSLRFFIRDKKKVKRTASQEFELTPLFSSNDNTKVAGKSMLRTVYVLDKFTIADAKKLDIELFEKNGGRNLSLEIKNKQINKAKALPK